MAFQDTCSYALRPDFRYLHAPLYGGLSEAWTVGRTELACALSDRIMLSRGGAFLVTGLRGVGKTTFVRLVTHLIDASKARYTGIVGDFQLVDVWINLARPFGPAQLMHHLIRHLYLRLEEMKLLGRLESELRSKLRRAFMRTSFEIASRSLVSEERSGGAEVGFGKAPWLGLDFLKASSSFKRTRSDEASLKYLPFDEKAAESEILNFAARLAEGMPTAGGWYHRLIRRLTRAPERRTRIKVLFVLDELDKLEAFVTPEGAPAPLDSLLETMKTVFSATDFSFVFIGGKDMHERLLEDVARGDSVYESIFAYDLYLPCLWEHQDQLLDRCLAVGDVAEGRLDRDSLQTARRYLQFKGRGIPRRTWRELNKHVTWSDGRPLLTLDLERRRYMEVFSKIQGTLAQERFFGTKSPRFGESLFDRRQLSLYYAIDWILSRGREPFTVAQVQEELGKLKLRSRAEADPSQEIADGIVGMLYKRAFIERVVQTAVTMVAASAQLKDRYRLAGWVLRAFEAVADAPWDPEEREASHPPKQTLEFQNFGKYRVLAKIGTGGFGTVYKVVDPPTKSVYAAKVLHFELSSSAEMLARFQREAQILGQLKHPAITRIYESGVELGRAYIIMEFVDGISLRRILQIQQQLPQDQTVAVAVELIAAFQFVHACGVLRNDIKPSNILFQDDGRVRILDFGISKMVDSDAKSERLTATGVAVGTPGYMAPEQLLGKGLDARSDIFSLGIVIYEMLTGENPFQGTSVGNEVFNVVSGQPLAPSKLASVSSKLEAIVMRALEKDPANRFQSMEEFGQALDNLKVNVDLAAIVQQVRKTNNEAAKLDDSRTEFIPRTRSAKVASAKADERPFPRASGPQEQPEPVNAPGQRGGLLAPAPALPWISPSAEQALSDQPAIKEEPTGYLGLLKSLVPETRKAALEGLCSSNPPGTFDLLIDFAQRVCFLTGDQLLTKGLGKERLILGRSMSADLPLPTSGISRQHAALFVLAEGVEVEDLGSANGTLLNKVRCTRERLRDGDVLTLGGAAIRVHTFASLDDSSAEAVPAALSAGAEG